MSMNSRNSCMQNLIDEYFIKMVQKKTKFNTDDYSEDTHSDYTVTIY